MLTQVTIQAAEVQPRRGFRGSGDAISGKAALCLHVFHRCVEPTEGVPCLAPDAVTLVEMVGTPEELVALGERITLALAAEEW